MNNIPFNKEQINNNLPKFNDLLIEHEKAAQQLGQFITNAEHGTKE